MAVMAMRRAITAPTPPPRTRPIRIMKLVETLAGGTAKSVVRMAIAMPIIPKTLPRRDVAGCDRPFSARMERRAPTTITEEIALVTDISGVWRAGVTDHTTK